MSDLFTFVDAVTPDIPKLRRRMGVVTYVGDHYIRVQVGGDATSTLDYVRYFGHVAPCVGNHVWLDTDGIDIVAVGTVAGVGSPWPSVRVYISADQSIPSSATFTSVTFNASLSNGYSMVSLPSTSVSAPLSGMYLLQGNVCWTSNATGYRAATISKGGTTVAKAQTQGTAAAALFTHFSVVVSATVGDAFSLEVAQTSGAALALNGGGHTLTGLGVTYLGPSL